MILGEYFLMNHDYAHCIDYKESCPKKCFRAELVRDLKSRKDMVGVPVSWMHFKGTDECPNGKMKNTRLIDADALKENAYMEGGAKSTAEMVVTVSDIDDAPTVDAVPVIRCKDCKYYEWSDNRAFGYPVKRCEWTGFEDLDDTDYCSRAEREEE